MLTVPALCADGQTLEQISREIVGSEPEDEEPLRYVQVSEWLHGLLEDDEDAEEGKAYWSWLKKDVPLVPELPRERSAVASGPFLPERVEVPIDGETSAALDRLAEVHDTAAEEVLFIAWQMFLGRLTGRDELAVERVLDGREDEELAEVPGPLARAIPIHCSIDPVLSLDALVERTADALQAALDWEIYFRREDEKEPDPTQNPVAFEALEWTGPELFAQSVSIERFKLQLSCLRQGGRWSAALRYDPRVFHRRDVEAMAQGFEALLADAVRRPGVPLAELRALGAEEERMVLEDLNRTAVEERSDTSVLSLFRRQVEQAGERPAIWFEGEAISYGELDARAGQLAGVMRARGVGPESRVALFLDRSPEALVAILAVLEAGGAYLCMDLDDPVERLTWMLEDAAPALVLTRGELQDRLPETTRPVLLLEEAAAETGAERVPEPAVDGDSLAYVLYTSGSTGRPKGVMVPHRGLLNYLNWALAEYVPAVDRGAAVHSSLGFDLTVTSIFCPLLSGGSVILLPEDRRVEELPEIRPEGGFSLLKLTPSHLELLRHALPEEALADLADVLILGGEALHWENLASWRRQAPQTRLINEYGPTETVVGCCTYEVPAEAAQEGHETAGPVPIGRPIANTRLYLLDRSLRPVPFGVIGELYVAGSGVVRGYLDRPTLSAERFLPNPFGERAGDRLYQTGDLARYRRVDGEVQLVYLGRNDDQIKVRGFRVEPGEIEGALRRHPAVEDAVVALHSSASGPLLTAYLIASDTLIAQDLRDHLGDFLPAAMIPTHFVPLDSFPLTPNGKVDRRALPEPTASRSLGGFEQEKPRGPVEARMLEIWEEELQQESFGVTDRFFDLGGDSIRAVRLIARLNEEFSANLTVPDVFQHQSVRELCAQLEQTSDRQSIAEIWSLGNEQIEQIKASILEDAEARAKLPPDFEDIYPMAGGEKGMAYYTLLMPDQPIYHDQYGYPLSIEDVARFVRCFELVVGRHTVLRTAYDLYRFSEPMKIVRRSPELPLHIEDLSRLDPAAQRARIQDYQTQDLYKHFTFDNEILWRLRVFVLKEGRAYVIWSWHHAIIDGWSDMTLWTELNNLYGREDFDSIDVLPEPKSSYRDYLAITLGQKVSPEIEEFWRQRVVGAERNRLPFGRPLVPTKTYGMKHLDVFLGEELLERLQKRSRELHVPLPTICLAAHLYLLWVISGEDEILTGLVTHDRPPIADSDRIVGCFLDTFPVQVDMRTIESRQALISLVSETLIAFRSNHLPLVDIGALAGSRAASGNPLFDTLFTFMDFHRLAEMAQDSLFRSKLAGEEPEEDDYYEERTQEMTNTKFDVEVITTLGYFLVRIKYDPDSFDKRDISTAGHLYRRVLEELISDVDQPLAPETLLTDAQRRVLVKDYNDTTVEYPQDLRLQDLLPARAESDRASQALVSGGRELSYGELGGRVQALAEQLLADGLRPGESVAVIFERSVELVVGILGVLEAGGAYVPIEPDIPAVRKGYIVANSGVSLVVADREYELEFPETAKAPEAVRFVLWGSDSAQASADATRPGPGPEVPGARPVDLAYTIYTSGSTGVPKGVMIEHHAAINLISWVNRTYGVDATHRILMLASVSFDLSVYDLFGSLLAGATLVVATREEQREPEKLKRLLTEERVTFWNSVPSSMAMLVRYLEEIEPSYRQEDLRVVFLSGDWIPVALPAKIRQFFPRCEVVSLGGATEATVWSIYHPIVEDVSRFNSVPYGRPLDNNSFHILSSRAELVPEGVIGELFIGGVGVARGYANDAVKTARAFVPDPFSPDPGARLYRTGDQGRRLPDGEIEFLGRRDHQVKIRGFRVELGEIESQLARHEQIEDLAVLARRDASGESYLCAYFVPRESSLSSGELEAFLAKTLPDYMIPTAFIPLEELPRNANGKLDRAALPEPGAYWTAEDRQMAAPENDAQKSLVEIWREVLGQEKIGIDHDFFELGGHSLSAMQVVTRIRTVFGVELPLRVFFESPTVRFLAERLAEQEATGGKGAAPRMDARCAASREPTPFLRPGAFLVSPEGQPREHRHEHRQCGSAAGGDRFRGPGSHHDGDLPASRNSALPLLDPGRQARGAHPAPGAPLAVRHRLACPVVGGPGGRPGGLGAGRNPPSPGPRERPFAAPFGHPLERRRGGGALRPPPQHRRWLVHGYLDPGVGAALRRVPQGGGLAPARAGDPVPGLRPVATALPRK